MQEIGFEKDNSDELEELSSNFDEQNTDQETWIEEVINFNALAPADLCLEV
jgi:hypothetical protein